MSPFESQFLSHKRGYSQFYLFLKHHSTVNGGFIVCGDDCAAGIVVQDHFQTLEELRVLSVLIFARSLHNALLLLFASSFELAIVVLTPHRLVSSWLPLFPFFLP